MSGYREICMWGRVLRNMICILILNPQNLSFQKSTLSLKTRKVYWTKVVTIPPRFCGRWITIQSRPLKWTMNKKKKGEKGCSSSQSLPPLSRLLLSFRFSLESHIHHTIFLPFIVSSFYFPFSFFSSLLW